MEGENQYINLLKQILEKGERRVTRNAVTYSIFNANLEFDLSDNVFPLFTVKKGFLRGIFEELMWILRGETNSKKLEEKGVNIWQQNSTREFLDSRGLHNLPTGDIGATYGFLMRHFGTEYYDCYQDYRGKGYDQLRELIKNIKEDPMSRRLVISLWSPGDLEKASLPPCMYFYQFYVTNDGRLSLKVSLRSSDVPVALQWNTAFAALFLALMARVTMLRPWKLYITLGDAHIYEDHLSSVQELVTRKPYQFPRLYIVNEKADILDYTWADIKLEEYHAHDPVKMTMIA